MSNVRFYLLFLSSISLFAQQEPEVYLMNLNTAVDSFAVSNFKNISTNKGYDSQPSFINTTTLIYAGTENDQTEIIAYDLNQETKSRLNKTTLGGEYSPQKFPLENRIAAVRLDPDGLQRLYSYVLNTNKKEESKELIPDYMVAYFTFYDNDNIVASIIIDDQLDLFKANLTTGEVLKITSNTGRSIHKVPGTNNVSYTLVNEDDIHEVYIINIMGDNESYYVCDLPFGIQDHCWLTDTQLLLGSDDKIYVYDLFGNRKWEEAADLSSENISEINRVTVSPDQKKLAIVASPKITQ
jgi:Tol biopolymer transport system component